jgi:hypothetical protein
MADKKTAQDKIKEQIDKAKLVGYDLQKQAGKLQQAQQVTNQQYAQNEQRIAQLESKLKE